MSQVNFPASETQDRSLARSRRAFAITRAERVEDELLDEELTPSQQLYVLDLIGAEGVFFFDTWAL